MSGRRDQRRSGDAIFPSVFVSYSSADVMTIRPLVDQFLAHGLHPWFAEYSIPLERYLIAISDDKEASQRELDDLIETG